MKAEHDFSSKEDYKKYLISYYSGPCLQSIIKNEGTAFIDLPSSDGSIELSKAKSAYYLAAAMAEIILNPTTL